jgi:prepilin-type N-terminal cleavage/methylation domain-containing protein
MNSHPQPRSRPQGFTLVELLTVIAIIAILMGLLFPAIGIVKEQARKADAKTTCTAIVAACKAYNTEYGKYPVLNTTGTPADLWFGDTGAGAPKDNSALFSTLRAKIVATGGADYNPRRIVFFEGKDASNPAAPKGGFAATGSSGIVGAFYDPWGTQYNVILDADYDNVITILPYSDFATAAKGPQTGCVAFSFGKDAKLGSTSTSGAYKSGSNTSDDVISWQ